MAAIEIETPRLAMVAWQERHRGAFARLNADPEVMRFFPSALTRGESDAAFDRIRADFDRRGWGLWAVEERSSARYFAGFCGLAPTSPRLPFPPAVEVAWRFLPAFQGRGLATEAARAAIAVAFDRIGLDEVLAFTAQANARSVALMQRIGMRGTRAGFDHPALPEGHALRRHVLRRLTRAEWIARGGAR